MIKDLKLLLKTFAVMSATSLVLSLGSTPAEAAGKTLGFAHVNLPDNIAWDEFVVKSIYFSVKNKAKKLKGATINYDGKLKNDAYVIGTIYYYNLDRTWKEPRFTIKNTETSSSKSKWTDKNGKTHTMTRSHIRQEPDPHTGYSEFKASVTAEFQLIDAHENKLLVSHYTTKRDDDLADALNKLLVDFYKKVNKEWK